MSGADLSAAPQLTLDLPLEPSFSQDDFLVSPSNAEAYEAFESWPHWPDHILLLIGPEGAGKSHLGAIWTARSGATRVAAGALPRCDEAAPEGRSFIFEDADRRPGSEDEFFHFLNGVRIAGDFLVITCRKPPTAWDLRTADLLSRLRQAPAVTIGAPDDSLVRAVLVKLFLDRQLAVDTAVVEFLALRIERSLAAARRIVAALDREGLARGRAVTRPMASEVLKRLEEADAQRPRATE